MPTSTQRRPTRQDIEAYAKIVAKEEGVPYDFLLRVMQAESSMNPAVGTSSAGAVGLMQIKPSSAAKGLDVHDWRDNIRAGGRYLSEQLERAEGNQAMAGGYYHSGPYSKPSKWGPITHAYMIKVDPTYLNPPKKADQRAYPPLAVDLPQVPTAASLGLPASSSEWRRAELAAARGLAQALQRPPGLLNGASFPRKR